MKRFASLLPFAVLSVGAYAADLYVPGQYPTIQGAISAARGGDTIHVAAGTYVERQIAWSGKSLTLQGAGQGQSIVDWGNWSGSGLRGVIQLYNVPSTARVDGFTIRNALADFGGGGMSLESSSPTVSNCTFTNCYSNFGGGGVSNIGGNPTFINCTFVANLVAAVFGGGFYNQNGSPTLTNCTFSGNRAEDQGSGQITRGGGLYSEGGNPTLTNCLFTDNHADGQGGGLFGDASVTGCTFVGNSAGQGGAITSVNCIVTNCILWGNANMFHGPIGTITYSDVQGGFGGVGNINADPLFVNTGGGNFHLSPGSPCINTGSNAAVTVATDLDGSARIVGGTVDMGAYELNLPSVSGHAYLDGYTGPVIGQLLEVEVWQGGAVDQTLNGNYGASGTFAFVPTVSGPAVLKFRFRTGLWKAVAVTLGGSPITNLTVNMTNGDCDHDNEVGIGDYSILSSVYGLSLGDPGYDANADLNGDETVDIADYAILSGSYGEVGD